MSPPRKRGTKFHVNLDARLRGHDESPGLLPPGSCSMFGRSRRNKQKAIVYRAVGFERRSTSLGGI